MANLGRSPLKEASPMHAGNTSICSSSTTSSSAAAAASRRAALTKPLLWRATATSALSPGEKSRQLFMVLSYHPEALSSMFRCSALPLVSCEAPSAHSTSACHALSRLASLPPIFCSISSAICCTALWCASNPDRTCLRRLLPRPRSFRALRKLCSACSTHKHLLHSRCPR